MCFFVHFLQKYNILKGRHETSRKARTRLAKTYPNYKFLSCRRYEWIHTHIDFGVTANVTQLGSETKKYYKKFSKKSKKWLRLKFSKKNLKIVSFLR